MNSGEFLSEIKAVPGIHFHNTFHLKSQVHFETFIPLILRDNLKEWLV